MIFVVGNSRSGTTMMGRILSKNPAIFTFKHEIHFFGQIYEPSESLVSYDTAIEYLCKLFRILNSGYFSTEPISLYRDESEKLLATSKSASGQYDPFAIYALFINSVTTQNGKSIGCDQTPRNLFYLKDILAHYPDAMVVNMIRDPRSVLLSQKNKWKRRFLGAKNIPYFEVVRSWANFHVITLSKLWNSSINSYKQVASNPNVISVRYEDLLSDPEKTIANLCSFLKVTYTPEMINIPVVGSSVRTDDNSTGIDNSRKDSWKAGGLSATEIFICERITKQNMEENGYELSGKKPSRAEQSLLYFIFPFKFMLSVALNISRNKNFINSIKRRLIT